MTKRTTDPADDTRRVVVVGGGAAGALVAANLLRTSRTGRAVDVRVIEREDVIGPGLAYRTGDPRHLLNNYAARLSVFEQEPDHLLHWCADRGIPAEPQSFLRRHLYGEYLTDVLATTPVSEGSRLHRLRGEVVDVQPRRTGFSVHLACGWAQDADVVVLALGNPPPRRVTECEVLGRRYVADPWAPGMLDTLSGTDRVLLVGTGLTMVDVAAQINATHPRTRMVAMSRHGLLPARHVRRPLRPFDGFRPDISSLSALLRDVRRRVDEVEQVGGDWRDVVDAIRPFADDLWQQLSPGDRERFVRLVSRRWEVLRHRMAPEMADVIDDLLADGTLRIARPDQVDLSAFSRVINCSGPASVCTPGWNAVVDRLAVRGLLRPNGLGLGLDINPDGVLLDASGAPTPGLYAVGAARRGVVWEVAAIPDLRKQAASLATHLLAPGTPGRALPA
ncbi:MAG: FAD/NAD(P)-binding protein [Actinomycetota bacterium]|nr:FAD/NAD(P)-binding protein [Actinomycetota bacterium]